MFGIRHLKVIAFITIVSLIIIITYKENRHVASPVAERRSLRQQRYHPMRQCNSVYPIVLPFVECQKKEVHAQIHFRNMKNMSFILLNWSSPFVYSHMLSYVIHTFLLTTSTEYYHIDVMYFLISSVLFISIVESQVTSPDLKVR